MCILVLVVCWCTYVPGVLVGSLLLFEGLAKGKRPEALLCITDGAATP